MFKVYFTRGSHLHVPWDWKFLLLAWVIAWWLHYLRTADPFQMNLIAKQNCTSGDKELNKGLNSPSDWIKRTLHHLPAAVFSPKFMCRVRIAQMDEIISFPFLRGCARNLTSSPRSTPPLLIENTLTMLSEASTCMPVQHFSFTKTNCTLVVFRNSVS